MSDRNPVKNFPNFADTGLWKLIISVSQTGVAAVLKNIADPDHTPVILFQDVWPKDEANLLERIEASVYENPRILEDFATHIIIYTPKVLWIPAEFTEDEEFDENLYTCVYPAAPTDIFADFGDEQVCLYSLYPGLNSFFQRTLPGCKVSSHLSILKSHFEERELERISAMEMREDLKSAYVNIRNDEADIFVFVNGKFICGATHPWREISDIAYNIFLVLQAYNLKPTDSDITVTGIGSCCADVANIISEFTRGVSYDPLPPLASEAGLPLAMALRINALETPTNNLEE